MGTGAAVGGRGVGEAVGVAGRDAGVGRRVAEGEGNGVAVGGTRGGIGVEVAGRGEIPGVGAGLSRSHARASTAEMTASKTHRATVRQDRFAVRSFSPFVSSGLFYLTSHHRAEDGERIEQHEVFEIHSNLAETRARPERTSIQGRDAWTLRSG